MPSVLSKLANPTVLEARLLTPLEAKTLTLDLVETCFQEQVHFSHEAAALQNKKKYPQSLIIWSALTRSLLQLYARKSECRKFMANKAIKDISLNLFNILLNFIECSLMHQPPGEALIDLLLFAQTLRPEKADAHQLLVQIWMNSADQQNHEKMIALLQRLLLERDHPECQQFAGTMLVMLTINQKYQPDSSEDYEDLLKIADPNNVAIVLAQAKHDQSGRNDHDILLRYRNVLKRSNLTEAERAMTRQHRALLKLSSKNNYPSADIISDLRHYSEYTKKPRELFFLTMVILKNPSAPSKDIQEGIRHLRFLVAKGHGPAHIMLGKILFYGNHGLAQSEEEGIRFLKQALSNHAARTEPEEESEVTYYAFGYYLMAQHLRNEPSPPAKEIEHCFQTAHELGNPYAGLWVARGFMDSGEYNDAISICLSMTQNQPTRIEGDFCVNNVFTKRYDYSRAHREAYYLLGKCYEHKMDEEGSIELAKQYYTAAIKLKSIPAVGQRLRCILNTASVTQTRDATELQHLVLTSFDAKVISEHTELIQCLEVIEHHQKSEQAKLLSEKAVSAPKSKVMTAPKQGGAATVPAPTLKESVQLVRPRSPSLLESLEEIAQNKDLSSTKKIARIRSQLKYQKDGIDAQTKSSAIRLIGSLIDQSQYASSALVIRTLDTVTALFDGHEIATLNQWLLLDIVNGLKKMKVSPEHPQLNDWLNPLCGQLMQLNRTRALTPKATLFLINGLTGLLPCRHHQLKRALSELIQLIAEDPISTLFPNSILVHSLALCHYGDPTLFDPRAFDPLIQQVVRESQTQTDERSQTQALLGLGYFSQFYQKTALFDTINRTVEQLVQARASSAHTEVTASRLQCDITRHLQHLTRRAKVIFEEEKVIAGLPVDCWIERYRTVENLVFQINGPCHYLLTQDHTGKEHYIPHVNSQLNHDHLTRAGCTVVELSFQEVPHTPELMKEKWNAEWLQKKIEAHREGQIDTASAKAPSSTAKAGFFAAEPDHKGPSGDGNEHQPAPNAN